MKSLNLVHAENFANASHPRIAVEFSKSGRFLQVHFRVESRERHVNLTFPRDSSQWGLWECDVVEVFVQGAGQAYFEFQLSPLGQFFELEIHEPRKKFNRDFQSGFRHRVEDLGDAWEAWFEIPWTILGNIEPESVTGNAFAVLGKPGAKTYWSSFLESQQKPDFHLPQFFRKFFA